LEEHRGGHDQGFEPGSFEILASMLAVIFATALLIVERTSSLRKMPPEASEKEFCHDCHSFMGRILNSSPMSIELIPATRAGRT
jgi:hypothetical protein